MPFRPVPKTTTDKIEQIANAPGLLNSSDVKTIAAAYLDLAVRYNRLQLFLQDFFSHTGFQQSKRMEDMIRELGPFDESQTD